MLSLARTARILATVLALIALTGCPAGPTSGMTLEKSPDGDIEILAIDKDGVTLNVAQLSQGEKSMMALVGDIKTTLSAEVKSSGKNELLFELTSKK